MKKTCKDIPAVLIVGSCGIGAVEIQKLIASENIKMEIIGIDECCSIDEDIWNDLPVLTLKDPEPIPMDIKLFSSKKEKNFKPHYRKRRGRKKK